MLCLDCQADNKDYARTCYSCGVSLQAARAWMYLEQAEISIKKSRYDAAADNLTRADLEMLTLDPNQRRQYLLTARAFYLQGIIYFNRGLMDKAEAEFQLAAENLAMVERGRELLATVYNRLGGIFYYRDDISKATDYYYRSSELASGIGAAALAARANTNLGNVAVVQGDIEQAIAHYQRALEQAQLSGDPTSIAQTCRALAQLYADFGPYKLALSYTAKSLYLCEQVESLDTRALILSDAANVYLRAAQPQQAEQCLRQANAQLRQVGDNIAEQAVIARMAELCRQQGDLEGWFNYANQAFNDTAGKVMFKPEAALQLALYYIAQQDWLHARRHLQILHDLAEGDLKEDAVLHRACAMLHAALDEWLPAEECFKQAFITAPPLSYDLACTWQEYATAVLRHASLSDESLYPEANHAFEQASRLFHRLELPAQLAQIEAAISNLPPELRQTAIYTQPLAVQSPPTIPLPTQAGAICAHAMLGASRPFC